ncbi:Caveolin-1 [Melia azedarach]|uniref:Caveolin-1 n=1 Tax=Melia azedarach TaxID=155640 RepID=A0ACC1YJ89_MELAZ|nr:Caveolin-1 [Melia azedarach]
MMIHIYSEKLLMLLSILTTLSSSLTLSHGDNFAGKILNVGEELWKETLPLRMGSRLYQLQGLKSFNWYEVKISYPASIPAAFSLQLKKGKDNLDLELNQNRRLLNTEKLIFKTDNLDVLNNQGGMYVLVTVEPEGIVAIPHVQEREFIIFNIVCDELLLGIPHNAWWVVVLVVICLGLALIVPYFLPPYLLPKNRKLRSEMQHASKES